MGLNVLSLFDGISCGRIALERLGIEVDNYFASEIDKKAIKVTMANFPDTQQIGDVREVNGSSLPRIDLLIGGSPCQGFSKTGSQLNFDDPRSSLFFEYVRILKECNPKFFMMENINMKQEWADIISDSLGVQPIFINSADFTAQDRKRLYWTNIPVADWTPKDVSWSDICMDGGYAGTMRGRRIDKDGKRDDANRSVPLVQYIESRKNNKTNCLTTVSKDNIVSKEKVGRTPLDQCEWRYLYRNEAERLQGVDDDYTASVTTSQAIKLLGNGWTVPVIEHIFKGLTKGERP